MGRDSSSTAGRWALSISIHSPRMGRDRQRVEQDRRNLPISIHSPRMGRDMTCRAILPVSARFQSTLPAWGETLWVLANTPCRMDISIHSPRMGRDVVGACEYSMQNGYFNPLSPHGERQLFSRFRTRPTDFNPLSPHGERRHEPRTKESRQISIHSPRMGRDCRPARGG